MEFRTVLQVVTADLISVCQRTMASDNGREMLHSGKLCREPFKCAGRAGEECQIGIEVEVDALPQIPSIARLNLCDMIRIKFC